MTRLRSAFTLSLLVVGLTFASAAPLVRAAADTLPLRLTDQDFWKLSEDFSEPNGYFRSDNLLSNEMYYPAIMTGLMERVKPGSVYLGVGPEQNFNYIVALKPKMVFITDIRRGNLHTQLMYKALFEMSADRAEFISRLFTKPRPAGLSEKATAADLMNAYSTVQTGDEAAYKANLQAIKDFLTKKPHTLPLSSDDLDGIEYVYYNFYWFGPAINYNSSTGNGGRGGNMVDYQSLMSAVDSNGLGRSFLASEDTFKTMKDLEEKNLLVPVVGNFGGAKALRAEGKYIRDHGAIVGAFYLSNVEQYLNQDGIWGNFCSNVASMPLDDTSTFIRSGQGGYGGGFGGFGGRGLMNSFASMQDDTRECSAAK